jgi:hypothetical protein
MKQTLTPSTGAAVGGQNGITLQIVTIDSTPTWFNVDLIAPNGKIGFFSSIHAMLLNRMGGGQEELSID